jgi:hypothetical protein
MKRQVHLSLEDELVNEIDRRRGLVSRQRWMEAELNKLINVTPVNTAPAKDETDDEAQEQAFRVAMAQARNDADSMKTHTFVGTGRTCMFLGCGKKKSDHVVGLV